MDNEKIDNPEKVGFGRMLAWQSRGISGGVQAVLIGYLMVYCTNALGMSATLVGTILMVSKLLDGVTDLFAGYLVDKTNTKWGKGRPYEICIIGLWLATWLVFSVPENAVLPVKCIWIFVCYAMAQSVFTTFLNANVMVYMVRAFNSEKAYVTLNSIGGLIVTFGVVVFNIIFPMFEAKIISSASGWSRLVLAMAVPLAILGLLRFLFIKEDKNVDALPGELVETVNFKDVIVVLKTNKYIYIVAFLLFVNAIISSMGITNYYFLYIVNNVGLMGVMSLLSIFPMITMLLYPLILKKISVPRLIQIGMLLTLVSGTINWFAGKNLVLLGIGSIIYGAACLPISFMSPLLIVDCASYNEWKGIPRMEGTLGCVTGFSSKIGAAFGSFLLGIMLSASGFDGTLTIQPDSAITMIRFIFSYFPTIFGVIVAVIMGFYKLDKLKPKMLKEIEVRKSEH